MKVLSGFSNFEPFTLHNIYYTTNEWVNQRVFLWVLHQITLLIRKKVYSTSVLRLSLTACLNSREILKEGTFFGSTVTFSPVLGFLACRRFLCLILNEPNPLISILFPAFRESIMLSNKQLTTDSVSFFVKPVLWAIALTRSTFVVVVPMAISSFKCYGGMVRTI